MNRLVWWAILVTGVLSTVTADVFMKKAAASWSLRSYSLGCLFYAITIPGWYFYMKGTRFATCGVLYSILTDSLILLLGVAYSEKRSAFANGSDSASAWRLFFCFQRSRRP